MRIIGNKWFWLVVFVLSWGAGGYCMFVRGGECVPQTGSPSRAMRIVSMAPNLTEILFELGLEERIVGVTADSNFPAEASDKPSVGTFWQPNLEAVVARRPDLIVSLGFDQQTNLTQRLERLGYETLTVNIEKMAHLYNAIERIGTAAGKDVEAANLVGRIQRNIESISERTAQGARLRVLWVIQIKPLRVAGIDTFINEFIELAGGTNAIGSTINKYPPIGAEQVIASRADVIMDLTGRNQEVRKYFERFGSIEVVKKGRICEIDPDIVSRLGPRIDKAVEVIARSLKPEVFEE